ncbi:EpsD family peptidyl-prolyl cis-trans isomerase [Piscinibacter sp. XHJ-5]|uniref:EpsD family peptidyl-prolyl cis-trans isomerase n=1 Tax=Piscinibacter sp. XHJ-5 TaxID=3037797 RepID=UPI0024528AEC|nr:EpsD family peptidyl-prolyl cis-trans isomerase [Piscinibacter sp. XHJ-5]
MSLSIPLSLMLVLSGALTLTGCSRVGGDATQVAAKVNDSEISLSQLQHVLQRQPPVPAERADAVARRVLDGLVDQELAAQGARSQGLDKDPRIVQAIEAAKRDILAKAYHDVVTEKAQLPSSDEVDRYYDSQPALFSQRRFYSLQETLVQGTAEELTTVKPRVEAAPDAARAAEALRDAHLRVSSRQVSVSPEDVPLVLLSRLSALRDGQSLMLPQPGGARVLTLVSSTPAPLTREAAKPAITSFLTNERKRQAAQAALKSLRESARIEYKGKFAASGSAAASAPDAGASASAR